MATRAITSRSKELHSVEKRFYRIFFLWMLSCFIFSICVGLGFTSDFQPSWILPATLVSVITGILTFIVAFLISLGQTFKRRNKLPYSQAITLGSVMTKFFLSGFLSILFLLAALPFMQNADGLSFDEKANIGSVNINRATLLFSFLSAGAGAVLFYKNFFRLTGGFLILYTSCLIALFFPTTFLHFFDAEKANDAPTSSHLVIISDRTECDWDTSLRQAKSCSVVITSDIGHGTGFSLGNGFFVTNKHVIEGATELSTWYNGEKPLTLWNYSPTLDIAIVRGPTEVPGCKWFNSDNLDLAEELATVGWPNEPSGDSTITKGIFSRLNTYEEGLEFIQTDAPINPGNSGGPLVNECGVVGVNTLKESWSLEELPRPLEGLGNALSSKLLMPVVVKLIAEGSSSVEIPTSSVTTSTSRSDSVPRQEPVHLSLQDMYEYRANLIEVKRSWEVSNSDFPDEDISRLLDSLNRQLLFSNELISRLEKSNGKASTDDIIMWDSIVKMSYESAAITEKLNSYYSY